MLPISSRYCCYDCGMIHSEKEKKEKYMIFDFIQKIFHLFIAYNTHRYFLKTGAHPVIWFFHGENVVVSTLVVHTHQVVSNICSASMYRQS